MGQRQLALRLRPKKFSQLIGQGIMVKDIQNFYKKNDPTALMFVGSTGTGKTTTARILSLSLQCTHGTIGEPCDECWKDYDSFSIREINASEESGVDAIKQIAGTSKFLPRPPSQKIIYILDEAQRLSKDSQKILLKYFEEAPESTLWIICTTEQGKILDALQSRCIVYELKKLSPVGIKKLIKRGLAASKSDLPAEPLEEALLEVKVQSPRLICNAIDKYVAGAEPKDAVKNLNAEYNSEAICKAVVNGDWDAIVKEVKDLPVEDLASIRAGVSGYLKGILEKLYPGVKAKEAAMAIKLVAEVDRYTVCQGPATIGVLYQLTQIFKDTDRADLELDD